jgi:hypothetical protein
MNYFTKAARLGVFVSILAFYALPAVSDISNEDWIDPSQHVRIVYNEFNTPDSMLFAALLERLYLEDELNPGARLQDLVSTNMNMTFSREANAWVISQIDTPRYSTEEVRSMVEIFLDLANESYEAKINTQRKIFCPIERQKNLSKESKLKAFERWDIEKDSKAEFYFDKAVALLGEEAAADLRSWLSRMKKSYMNRRYNPRTLWEGRENELDARFERICNDLGEVK